MLRTHPVIWIFSAATMVLGTGGVSGQDYPNKPIRIITGPAGGSSDFPARLIAQGISGYMGQPLVIENRSAGAFSGSAELASKAQPDGYTMLMGGGSIWLSALQVKTPYDPIKDFSTITMISRQVRVLAVNASVPVNSIKELIATAKAKPGALNFASGATGGTNHLAMEIFKDMTGVNMVHIPYKGGTPAINAVVAGETQLGIFDVGPVVALVKSGKLKALAVTSAGRSAFAPGVPSMAESGLPGYDQIGMLGVFVPARTPRPIIDKLNREIVRFIIQPDVKERLLNAGEEVVASTPEEFSAAIKADMASKDKIIKALGLQTN